MPKRPLDDNAVATQVIKNDRSKEKKRKLDEAPPALHGSATAISPRPSEKQSKESRRLRKLENDFNPSDSEQKEGIIEVSSNGGGEDGQAETPGEEGRSKAAEKAARKAERAMMKGLKKEGKNKVSNGEGGDEHAEAQGEKGRSKAAEKAARKAERAMMKGLKKEGDHEANETSRRVLKSASSGATSHISQQLSSSIRKNSNNQSRYTEDPNLTAIPASEIDTFLRANFVTVTDPTSSAPLRPIINFSHLPRTNAVGKSPFATFKSPTPIQAAAWPYLLSGRDVIGVAETGSGKTLAFGIPCIRSISTAKLPSTSRTATRAVIVAPTRELAVQIHTQISPLAESAGLSAVCVYGGVLRDPQRVALATAQIIVATPGRLNDFIYDGAADLSKVTYLVLDEADRMLDDGFEPEIRKIIACTPSASLGRQTLMFTATWPPSIRALAFTFLASPVHISIGKDNPTGELRAKTSITQKVEVVSNYDKEARLLQLVKTHQSGEAARNRILVFCLYKKEAVRVENYLRMQGRHVVAIQGGMGQAARSKSLEAFRQGACPLLVATDVAARGLDIPDVKLVINLTFPLTVEDYVHRIGRTGRASSTGLAITLFTEHDKAHSGALINVLRAAGQEVPEALLKFGGTVKKKGHEAYGAFYREAAGDGEVKVGKKIVF